jgi:hypothetical protein
MTRFRITVRGTDIELRGYVDGEATATILARAVDGFAMVVASPADDNYDPFNAPLVEDPPQIEDSRNVIEAILAGSDSVPDVVDALAVLHHAQATVIRGERTRAEAAERELISRELHHFEVEQENARLQAEVDRLRERQESQDLANEAIRWKGKALDRAEFERDILAARANHPETPAHTPVVCGYAAALGDIDAVLRKWQ